VVVRVRETVTDSRSVTAPALSFARSAAAVAPFAAPASGPTFAEQNVMTADLENPESHLRLLQSIPNVMNIPQLATMIQQLQDAIAKKQQAPATAAVQSPPPAATSTEEAEDDALPAAPPSLSAPESEPEEAAAAPVPTEKKLAPSSKQVAATAAAMEQILKVEAAVVSTSTKDAGATASATSPSTVSAETWLAVTDRR
jgi:hypothetical protein